jgi:hypothetical protein
MTQTTVAAQIHQTLYVHLNFTAKITLNRKVSVDIFAYRKYFCIAQFVYSASAVNFNSFADLYGRGAANTSDICQGDWNPFICWDVYARYTCQINLPFRCGSVVPEPFFTTPELTM